MTQVIELIWIIFLNSLYEVSISKILYWGSLHSGKEVSFEVKWSVTVLILQVFVWSILLHVIFEILLFPLIKFTRNSVYGNVNAPLIYDAWIVHWVVGRAFTIATFHESGCIIIVLVPTHFHNKALLRMFSILVRILFVNISEFCLSICQLKVSLLVATIMSQITAIETRISMSVNQKIFFFIKNLQINNLYVILKE